MMSDGSGSVTRWLMLGVAVVGSNSLALSPVLGDVAASLGAAPVVVARAGIAYGGATALSALLLGGLIDRFGPGPSLVGGLAALAAAMLGSAAAGDAVALALSQALAGAAAGVALPASYALAAAAATLARAARGRPERGVTATPGALSGLAGALRQPGMPMLLAICLLYMAAFYGCYAYLGDAVRRALSVDAGPAGTVVLAYGVGFGLAAFGDRFIARLGALRLLPVVLAALAAVYGAMGVAVGGYAAIVGLAAVWGFVNHFGLNLIVLLVTRAAPARRGAALALNSAVAYLGELLGTGLCGLVYEGSGFGGVAAFGAACALVATLLAARLAVTRREAAAAGP